jgi:hypothetical protein
MHPLGDTSTTRTICTVARGAGALRTRAGALLTRTALRTTGAVRRTTGVDRTTGAGAAMGLGGIAARTALARTS